MFTAITRAVSRSILNCELTHLERVPIDLERARLQHQVYEETLRTLGVKVHQLPEEPDLPDSVFVEDTAIILDECAILTRPGADSRKAEVESMARALKPYRKLFPVQAPGTVDGGDVLVVGKRIWIGLTTRSNNSAIKQIQAFLKPHGYSVQGVPVSGCLHLKSAICQATEKTLLINPAWVQKSDFPGLDLIDIDPSEPAAANILRVGEQVIYQPVFPRTLELLQGCGINPVFVDASELAKAEGALTCCSLIFKTEESI